MSEVDNRNHLISILIVIIPGRGCGVCLVYLLLFVYGAFSDFCHLPCKLSVRIQ